MVIRGYTVNFEELAIARRSAMKFVQGIEIPDEDFKKYLS